MSGNSDKGTLGVYNWKLKKKILENEYSSILLTPNENIFFVDKAKDLNPMVTSPKYSIIQSDGRLLFPLKVKFEEISFFGDYMTIHTLKKIKGKEQLYDDYIFDFKKGTFTKLSFHLSHLQELID